MLLRKMVDRSSKKRILDIIWLQQRFTHSTKDFLGTPQIKKTQPASTARENRFG